MTSAVKATWLTAFIHFPRYQCLRQCVSFANLHLCVVGHVFTREERVAHASSRGRERHVLQSAGTRSSMKTAVSIKESESPTAAKSLDFSVQILHADAARRRRRACYLLTRLLPSYEASAEEVVACFSTENQNSVQQCLLSVVLHRTMTFQK